MTDLWDLGVGALAKMVEGVVLSSEETSQKVNALDRSKYPHVTFAERRGIVASGRFLIFDQLAQMIGGVVLLALDEETGQLCSIKLLVPHGASSNEAVEGYERESAVRRKIDLSILLPEVAAGRYSETGCRFRVSPYASRGDLSRWCKDGDREIGEVLGILTSAAAGLGRVHEAGIVHADIKPENILIGGDSEVWISDWGHAVFLEEEQPELPGTYEYLTPEQILGKPLLPATDVFAFGLTLFHALTGRYVVGGRRSSVLDFQLIASGELSPPSETNEQIPTSVDEFFERCTKADPEERYRDGAALRIALDKVVAELPE